MPIKLFKMFLKIRSCLNFLSFGLKKLKISIVQTMWMWVMWSRINWLVKQSATRLVTALVLHIAQTEILPRVASCVTATI